MTTTTTITKTKTVTKPVSSSKLLLNTDIVLLKSELASPVIATPTFPSSPIATGSFYLPIKQKVIPIKQKINRRGRYHHKHLRKPPSFDTYLHYPTSSSATNAYLTSPSMSSSYSSTSSLADNEDVMCGYGFKSNNHSTPSVHSPRLRRASSGYKVRFAEDDGSSIVSSSSGGSVDDWDDFEIDEEEEEEEDYILIPQLHYNYHKKSGSA